MKKKLKIIKYFIYFLFGIIIFFLFVTILPIKNNYQIKVVLSGSMEPEIHVGSVIILGPKLEYKVGDIVIFGKDNMNNIPITHRIISTRRVNGESFFTTKGDANNSPDNIEITEGDIHGRVLFSIPYLGYILDFIKRPIVMFIVVFIPVLLIIFGEIKNIIKEIKQLNNPKILED